MVLGQKNTFGAFPFSRYSKGLQLSKFIICQPTLKFDENRGVADAQFDHSLRSLPRPVNVQELVNLHLFFQHKPPKDIRSEHISPGVGNDLTGSNHQKEDEFLGNLQKR
jgi:hypothetical protein